MTSMRWDNGCTGWMGARCDRVARQPFSAYTLDQVRLHRAEVGGTETSEARHISPSTFQVRGAPLETRKSRLTRMSMRLDTSCPVRHTSASTADVQHSIPPFFAPRPLHAGNTLIQSCQGD